MSAVRIATFGWIVTAGLLLSLATAATLSVVAQNHANEVTTSWSEFEGVAARKAIALTRIRVLLGFNGLNHHFENYMLRKERQYLIGVYQAFLELSVAVAAYRSLGLTPEEDEAFNVVVSTIEKYKGRAAIAEALVKEGKEASEIDRLVMVDDVPTVEALNKLEKISAAARRNHAEQVYHAVEKISDFAVRSGVALILILGGLSVLTIWFIHQRLIRRLKNVVAFFGSLNPREPGAKRLPIARPDSRNELDILAKSGNQFVEAFQEHSLWRAKAEADLRDREAYLKSLVQHAVDAIITIDQKGNITGFNAAASAMFNYSLDEVLGNNVNILIAGPHSDKHDAYLRQYLKTGESKVMGVGRESEALRRNGDVFPVRIAVSRIDGNDKLGFTAIVRDLSVEKEAELRLRMAKDAADKANRAKSQFLASMSHELRTPMNAIIGFCDLMESHPIDPPSKDQKEYLGYIKKGGETLMELIGKVLELSEIETGQLTVKLQQINPAPIIKDCLTILSPRAQVAQVALEQSCSPEGCPTVYTDEIRFRQILTNFLSNAVKYNVPGGHVTVDCRTTAAGRVRISVRDTGEGIAPEKQRALFEPFNRLGREAGTIEGTGIGLTITKQIAEALGGSIGFHSEPGQGSEFWVDLPSAAPADATD